MSGNYFILAAFLTVAIGFLPLFVRKRFLVGGILSVVGFFVFWFGYWSGTPSTVYPFFGPVGFWILLLWIASAVIDGVSEEKPTWLAIIPTVGVVIYIGSFVWGWSAFHAQTYSMMIGPVEERVWTQDVQPKDPRHMVMVSGATANFLAKKAVAQGGAIGSQFELDTKSTRLQRVHGELVYVYPFDFNGVSSWQSTAGVPAYIIVYAEDAERTPKLVILPKDKVFRYTTGAFFEYDLERHLRNNGFLHDGLEDIHLELDEQDNPFWVVTTYQPTITWFGEKVTGVATINPATGEIARYAPDKIPDWVDRVVPRDFVKSYLTWRGELTNGWWNTQWGKFNITEPEDSTLIYGEADKAEFVTGMTSTNTKDDSLIGLMYTDSRTGKTVYYRVNGGATDTAILAAVNANQQVQYRHLRATTPQIYNVYGSMAAVVPLINDTGAYQGVAIVSVLNVQDVAVGATQLEALRNYQSVVARLGQQVSLEKSATRKRLTGVIDRIRQDLGGNGGVYYFHIDGAPRIFTASSQNYSKLPLTQAGDTVIIDYVASGEDVVPVNAFDNLSLPLDKTKAQDEVELAAKARLTAETTRKEVKDVTEQLRDMSPDEFRRLREMLQKQ